MFPDIKVGAVAGDDADKKLESVIQQANEWGRQLSNESLNKVYKDASGTQRILISGEEGVIKISEEGVDVADASDDELNFNSDQNVFKIVQSGTTTIEGVTFPTTAAGNVDIATANPTVIDHNLGYVPVVLAFIDSGSGYLPLPYKGYVFNNGGTGGFIFFETTVHVTSTQLQINRYAWGGDTTGSSVGESTVKYYLLQETAA